MDFDLVHGLRLKTESENKRLYGWSINEIDRQGQPVGDDQIPWVWSLYFTAVSCELRDNFEIKPASETEGPAPAEQSQTLVVRLRPGRPGRQESFSRETTFSMFGTDRNIENISLEVYPHPDPADQDRCTAWGTVSYTTEVDFRNETTEDCVVFYLSVKPETFDGYAAKVLQGSVDELVLRVGLVDGFYSEWSPAISTANVKVLTGGDEQKVAMPRGVRFEPPRLGAVGKAQLSINRHLEFGKGEAGEEASPRTSAARGTSVNSALTGVNGPTARYWRSMRRAAWCAVVLLALIFIAVLLKR